MANIIIHNTLIPDPLKQNVLYQIVEVKRIRVNSSLLHYFQLSGGGGSIQDKYDNGFIKLKHAVEWLENKINFNLKRNNHDNELIKWCYFLKFKVMPKLKYWLRTNNELYVDFWDQYES